MPAVDIKRTNEPCDPLYLYSVPTCIVVSAHVNPWISREMVNEFLVHGQQYGMQVCNDCEATALEPEKRRRYQEHVWAFLQNACAMNPLSWQSVKQSNQPSNFILFLIFIFPFQLRPALNRLQVCIWYRQPSLCTGKLATVGMYLVSLYCVNTDPPVGHGDVGDDDLCSNALLLVTFFGRFQGYSIWIGGCAISPKRWSQKSDQKTHEFSQFDHESSQFERFF